MKRYWLAGAAALALIASVASAQITGLISRTLTGNEVVVAAVGGPGGLSFFVPTAQLRNAQGVTTTSATTGTLTMSSNNATLIFTAASGGAQTINLPTPPWDGEIFEIVNGTASTAFTTGSVVATTDSSTITGGASANALSTLAAGASAEWRYVAATTTWYRMR